MKKQTKINFHIHSTGSDGKMSPEEVVKEAIANGLHFICFTDHYKFPKNFKEMNGHHPVYLKELLRIQKYRENFHNPSYVKEVRKLAKTYSEEIDVSFGVEIDWLEYDIECIAEEIKKESYDYVLGSVHCIPLKGVYWPVDCGKGGKKELLKCTINLAR